MLDLEKDLNPEQCYITYVPQHIEQQLYVGQVNCMIT